MNIKLINLSSEKLYFWHPSTFAGYRGGGGGYGGDFYGYTDYYYGYPDYYGWAGKQAGSGGGKMGAGSRGTARTNPYWEAQSSSENWLGLNILRKLARSQYFEKCAQKPGGSLNAALKVEAFDANLMFSQTQTQWKF